MEALARGLRLPDRDRDLLFELAGHAAPGRDIVPTRITPSVQRLLDRLAATPVAVYGATWTLLTANAAWNAVLGDTSAWDALDRNAIRRNLTGAPSRVVHSPESLAELQERQVADLRVTAIRYPADRAVQRLVATLIAESPRFRELWDADVAPAVGAPKAKQIAHPTVGRIALDCDILVVATDDVRVMVYTAEPGTVDAERLELAIVLGTQSLVS